MNGKIDAQVWNELMRGLVLKKYNLLFGAGASRDVKNRSGKKLPDGKGMAKLISEAFQLNLEENETGDLSRIYRVAQNRQSSSGLSLDEWLRQEFTRCQPPEWYNLIHFSPWRSLWTLNIDDALEMALGREVMSYNYTDVITDGEHGRLPLVHLHGYAKRPEDGLIFSLPSYRTAVVSPRARSLAFEEILSDQPFVIVGAALHHEFDLAQALAARSTTATGEFPSIAVMPQPSELTKSEFDSWNISIYDGTAEDFFEDLRDGIAEATNQLIERDLPAQETPTALRFLEQWHRYKNESGDAWRDYFSGQEPEYSDVVRGDVIRRTIETALEKHVISGTPALIWGKPFVGKSSLVLHAVHEFARTGWDVFYFAEAEKPDLSAVIARIRANPKTILVAERASEFRADFISITQVALDGGLPFRLILLEREGHESRLLDSGLFESVRVPDHLDEVELSSFIHLLVDRGRISTTSRAGMMKRIQRQGGSTIAKLITREVLKEGFEERVRRDYRSVRSARAKDLVLTAAICSSVGQGISVGLASAAIGVTPRGLEEILESDDTATTMVHLRNNRLQLRHRLFAELLTQQILVDRELSEVVLGIAKAIAPQLSVAAIHEGQWVYRMARVLMDHDYLAGLIGRPSIASFYKDTETEFGWNSRFWEQRALAASHDHQEEPALRYARTAVGIENGAFQLNTLATVRFRFWRSKTRSMQANLVNREFWECTKICEEARSKAHADAEHPYVTWFFNAVHYGRWMRQSDAELTHALRREWQHWWTEAQASNAFAGEAGHRQLRRFQSDWISLGVNSTIE